MNPKNLAFIVGGATAVTATDVAGSEQAIAWVVFTVIATVGVAAPMVIYLFMGRPRGAGVPRRSQDLDGAQRHGSVMAVLCVIIGVKLVGGRDQRVLRVRRADGSQAMCNKQKGTLQ